MSLETSLTDILKLEIGTSERVGKSGKGWLESSSLELDANNAANSLALSEDDEITSGPLMMVGIGDLPSFKIGF